MRKVRWRKTIVAGAILMSLGMVCPMTNLQAEEVDTPYEEIVEASDGSISTYADQIGYIYRIYKGRKQRRRWNYTQGEWYDKSWEDLGPA